MFKEASRLKLRFLTSKGSLSVEQLWDLPLTELDTLAVNLEKAYNESKGKSFLIKKSTQDKDIKLSFDIVLEILNTKVAEKEEKEARKADKEHNQKILAIIEEKEEQNLKSYSVEQLRNMLKQ